MTDTNLTTHTSEDENDIQDAEAEVVSSRLKRSLRERLAKALGFELLGAKIDERGARNDHKAAESRLKASESQQNATVLKSIKDFFHDNTAFSREDFNDAKLGEEYKALSEDQKKYFDRMAETRIAINELATKTIEAQAESNTKNIEDLHRKNEIRQEYASQLREESEEYQEVIEDKIAEAQDYLRERKYKEALNVTREAKQLLTGEKSSVTHLWRKAVAKTIKLFNGSDKDVREFCDAIMQRYFVSLSVIATRAEAGLDHEGKKEAGKIAAADIPEGDREKIYKSGHHTGFILPGIGYNLAIKNRFQAEGRTAFVVQQTNAVGGEKRYAIMSAEGKIKPEEGFFINYKLLPGKTKNDPMQLAIQRNKGEAFEYQDIPSAPTTTP